jgi:hypothetical protein
MIPSQTLMQDPTIRFYMSKISIVSRYVARLSLSTCVIYWAITPHPPALAKSETTMDYQPFYTI